MKTISRDIQSVSPSFERRSPTGPVSSDSSVWADAMASLSVKYVSHEDFDDADLRHAIVEGLAGEADTDHCDGVTYRQGPSGLTVPNTPVLTAEVERALFKRMNCLRHLASCHRERALEREVRRTDVVRVRNLLESADCVRSQIAAASQRLVLSLARRFASRSHDLADLSGEANVVLMRAIDLFDVSRGFRFSTYATHAISRALARLCQNERSTVVVTDCVPEPINDELPCDWIDIHPAELVRDVLGRVPARVRRMMELRFGLAGNAAGMTYQEIADVVDLSVERVRQLIVEHCRRLRRVVGEAAA